jgi:hypothetical protein
MTAQAASWAGNGETMKRKFMRKEYGPSEGLQMMRGLNIAIAKIQREEAFQKATSSEQLKLAFPTASERIQ